MSQAGTEDPTTSSALLSKVPAVTLMFWIIKVVATTLGETGGDAASMSLNLGYAVASMIFIAIFVVAVVAQVTRKTFHPFLYWAVIVATTTAGTTMADFADRSLGIGYTGGSSILFVLLMASLGVWYWAEGTVSVERIFTRRAEIFYWVTILFLQTLGTALGEWMATRTGSAMSEAPMCLALGCCCSRLRTTSRKSRTSFCFGPRSSSRVHLAPPWAI